MLKQGIKINQTKFYPLFEQKRYPTENGKRDYL